MARPGRACSVTWTAGPLRMRQLDLHFGKTLWLLYGESLGEVGGDRALGPCTGRWEWRKWQGRQLVTGVGQGFSA